MATHDVSNHDVLDYYGDVVTLLERIFTYRLSQCFQFCAPAVVTQPRSISSRPGESKSSRATISDLVTPIALSSPKKPVRDDSGVWMSFGLVSTHACKHDPARRAVEGECGHHPICLCSSFVTPRSLSCN